MRARRLLRGPKLNEGQPYCGTDAMESISFSDAERMNRVGNAGKASSTFTEVTVRV